MNLRRQEWERNSEKESVEEYNHRLEVLACKRFGDEGINTNKE